MVEIFAGSATLTCTAKKLGMYTLAIDYAKNKHKPKAQVFRFDLGLAGMAVKLIKMIRDMLVNCHQVLIVFAPPSGTGSRAREIKIRGRPDAPKPLRSERFPAGLPNLDEAEKKQVECANTLYQLVADVVNELYGEVYWIIENPTSSYMWHLPYMVRLLELPGALDTDLTACNFGGRRPKRTRLRSNVPGLQALAGGCSGAHPNRHGDDLHAPWGFGRAGSFATAEEAEYPEELCRRVLEATFGVSGGAAELPGASPAAASSLADARTDPNKRLKHLRAAGAGRQARGRPSLQVLPEHKSVAQVVIRTQDELQAARAWALSKSRRLASSASFGGEQFQAGAQLLAVDDQRLGGTGGVVESDLVAIFANQSGQVRLRIGVPWSPEEFFNAALKVEHPFARGYPLRGRTADGLARLFTLGPTGTLRHREEVLARWKRRAAELEGEEAEVHSKLPEDVERVVRNKRLLLFAEILREIGFKDMDAMRSMLSGFPVVGPLPDSEEFPPKEVPARDSLTDLIANARAVQAAVREAGSSGDKALDEELYAATEKEVSESGVLRGPVPVSELDAKFGKLWVPARRFGLRQGTKLRPIDDFSEGGHNATVEAHFKVDLGGVDEVVAVAREMGRAFSGPGDFVLTDEAGKTTTGEVHRDWRTCGGISGCCLDLVSAFRQVPRSAAHAPFTVVAVLDPAEGVVKYFELLALAFGQMAAVYAFNRVARALDAIFAFLLIPCSNYVDDYPLVLPDVIAEASVATAKAVLELLGWAVKDPQGLLPSTVFKALGVIIDLSGVFAEQAVVVKNRQERIEEDVRCLYDILTAEIASPALVRRLRGRLQFASSQTFGRCGAFASRLIRDLAGEKGSARRLSAMELVGLAWWRDYLGTAKPRVVKLSRDEHPVVICTDGAVEDVVSVGGVLYDPLSGAFEFFGEEVPAEVARSWGRATGREQIIGQAEIAPLTLAALLWREFISGRYVIMFADNDSARDAAIRGYSPSLASAFLVSVLWGAMAGAGASPWFDRVPGPSNPADDPSRLRFRWLEQLRGKRRRLSELEWQFVTVRA